MTHVEDDGTGRGKLPGRPGAQLDGFRPHAETRAEQLPQQPARSRETVPGGLGEPSRAGALFATQSALEPGETGRRNIETRDPHLHCVRAEDDLGFTRIGQGGAHAPDSGTADQALQGTACGAAIRTHG